MAKHDVTFELPKHQIEIGRSDVTIQVRRNNQMFGTITISRGSIEWWPSYAKKPYKMGWRGFDEAILKYFNE